MPSYEGIAERFLQAAPLREESWCRVIVLFIYLTWALLCALFSGVFKACLLFSNQALNMLYSIKWANSELVQKALHIREVIPINSTWDFIFFSWMGLWKDCVWQGTITEWARCNGTLKLNDFTFDVESTVDYHKKLSLKDCRALIYRWTRLMDIAYNYKFCYNADYMNSDVLLP